MSELAKQTCEACKGGIPPFDEEDIKEYMEKLGGDWTVIENHHIEKEFKFDDFVQALAFTNKVGELAEQQGHHPDILLSWGKVKITTWTHKIDGLFSADFVLAAKIDELS